MLPFGISNPLHAPSNGLGNAGTSILSNTNDSMNESGPQCAPSFLFGQTQHGLKRRNHPPSSIAGKSVHWSPLLVQESTSSRRDAEKESTKNLVTSSLWNGPPLRSLMDDPPPEKQLRAADASSLRPSSGYQFASGRSNLNGSSFSFSAFTANCGEEDSATAAADTSQRREQDYWVTIFGFPIERTSSILELFSKHGNIVTHKSPKKGNWVNVRYSSTIHAQQALVRNGKLVDGIMIGVISCTDPDMIGEVDDTSNGHHVIQFRANTPTLTVSANVSTLSSFDVPSANGGVHSANSTMDGADKSDFFLNGSHVMAAVNGTSGGNVFAANSLNTGRQSRLSISSRSGMRPLNRHDYMKNNSLNNSSIHQKSSDESLFGKLMNYITPH